MNVSLFLTCIEDPSRLRQVSYQEWKTLVLQFPYAACVRMLLWEKSAMEDHPDKSKNLQAAALYTPDRTFLARKAGLAPGSAHPAIQSLVAPEVPKAQEITASGDIVLPPSLPHLEETKEITETNLAAGRIVPLARETFASWNANLDTPFARQSKVKQPRREKGNLPLPSAVFRNSEQQTAFMAERSIQENGLPLSETYAKLLVRQGRHERAIAVYRQLVLLFPEKSDFFAAEIEKLKTHGL